VDKARRIGVDGEGFVDASVELTSHLLYLLMKPDMTSIYEVFPSLRSIVSFIERDRASLLMSAAVLWEFYPDPFCRPFVATVAAWSPVDVSVKYPLPDWVFDKHTKKGAAMGRGMEHFLTEGLRVNQRLFTVVEPYELRARALYATNVRASTIIKAYKKPVNHKHAGKK
jgi:hypothetical protein